MHYSFSDLRVAIWIALNKASLHSIHSLSIGLGEHKEWGDKASVAAVLAVTSIR